MKTKLDLTILGVLSEFGAFATDEATHLIAASVDDSDDEDAVKRMLRVYVVPYVQECDRVQKGFLSNLLKTLQYALTLDEFPSEAIRSLYYEGEPVLRLPTNPIDYYKWAWEVLHEPIRPEQSA